MPRPSVPEPARLEDAANWLLRWNPLHNARGTALLAPALLLLVGPLTNTF